ncbi:uncharacterized protein L203_101578 [Cryptococcus depauperatus CBS 7841]|uniref:Uncharacterized protein n=1 Tax=Cryptococcus depauperatus CBS 7841 TaxID=1295531 RepID=A0A1E3ITN9_9TREE|nr:hypothetical protein L203_01057 [Cryptococcus depauperatus CBS 7841]
MQSPATRSDQHPNLLPSRLLSKRNTASTSSPNTTASNRRRFGGLLADLGLDSTLQSETSSRASPSLKSMIRNDGPGIEVLSSSITSFADRISALSLAMGGDIDSKRSSSRGKDRNFLHLATEGVYYEGCFVDGASEDSVGGGLQKNAKKSRLGLIDLPEDLILEVFSHLPSDHNTLHVLSQVSRRLYRISQSPSLWARVLESSGCVAELKKEVQEHAVGVWRRPKGAWHGINFVADTSTEPIQDIEGNMLPSNSIPLHYPTLYRTLQTLPTLIRSLDPAQKPTAIALESHQDSVYCVQQEGRWMVTGSRDKSFKIWDLTAVERGEQGLALTVPEAHEGSILGLAFDLDTQGKGTLVTASSDCKTSLWNVDLSEYEKTGVVHIQKKETFRHSSTVLDVALTPSYVVTGTKDCHVRVYSRKTLELHGTLSGHRGPINCITPHKLVLGSDDQERSDEEAIVSASGDGNWIIWDAKKLVQIRKGAGNGRGLACVAWERDYILTGDNESLIKLYDASTANLLRIFQGHNSLVRAVSMRLREGLVVSGSYNEGVLIWDLYSGHLIKRPTLPNQSSLVFDLQMSANRLIIVGHDRTIKMLTWGTNLPYTDLLV